MQFHILLPGGTCTLGFNLERLLQLILSLGIRDMKFKLRALARPSIPL